MEVLSKIILAILELGAPVFMGLLMMLLGVLFKMKLKDAISSGLMLGVAFIGINAIIGLLLGGISPAAMGFAQATGKNLTTIDTGWPVASAITWSWPYVILVFPVVIGINIIMLLLKKTKTVNVDLWNVWGFAFVAFLGTYFTGHLWVGLLASAIYVVICLLIGDALAPKIQKMTGVPGVSCPHPLMTSAVPVYLIDLLLRKIPFLNTDFSVEKLKEKIGIFGENHIIGFILGFVISLIGGFGVGESLTTGITTGASFILLPMVARLFMQALAPISSKVGDALKTRFKDREIYIGIDWPFMAGRNEIWVIGILSVPINMLLALIMPNNTVMPLASIVCISVPIAALAVCDGNILRMGISSLILTPIHFLLANKMAPALTSLAVSTGAYTIEAGQTITFFGLESPEFRYLFLNLIEGRAWAYIGAAIFFVVAFFFLKAMKAEN